MRRPEKIFIASLLLLVAAGGAAVLSSRFAYAPRTIASGCFHQVAHQGAGCAALVEKADGQIILQLSDFRTTEKEDLHVLLIDASDALENETVKAAAQLYIAPLRSAEGSQRYVVPPGRDLAEYNAVVIWHGKHGVNFTTAPLKRF